MTVVAAALLVADGAMTVLALDRWRARDEGVPSADPITAFIDARFDDEFMESRFQTLTLGGGVDRSESR